MVRSMRKLLVCLLAVVLVSGLSGLGSDAAAADEQDGPWQQSRHNAQHNPVLSSGVDEIYTGVIHTPDEVRATPSINNGKLFVANHPSGYLLAYDLVSGEELWRAQAPNWVHSEMVHRDGHVFVGYGNRHMKDDGVRGTGENGVLCLDADTGEVVWQAETDGEVMPTPAVVGDSVYIATGDRHLYELDPETGEKVVRAELGGNANMSDPTVIDGMLYVGASGTTPNVFTAYDTEADEVAWQREFDKTRSMGDVPPAIAGGIVVTTAPITLPEDDFDDGVHERHMIFAMDATTGELLWQDALGQGPAATNNRSGAPMIHDGTVYVGSPITKAAYAYDLHSGERKWVYHTGAVKGAPVAADGTVYFATTDGWIHALDVATGDKVGERYLGGALAPSGPAIVDDVLIVGSQDNNVYLVPTTKILGTQSFVSGTSPVLITVTIGLGVLVLALATVVVLQARQLRQRSVPRRRA